MFIQDTVKTYKGLPGSVYIIFVARVVNCLGNFVYPFMTLLLTAKVGMSEKQAGFFLLAGYLVGIPGSILGGKITDIIGRKKIMLLSMTLSALCLVPCAFFVLSTEYIKLVPYLLIAAGLFNSIGGPAGGAMMNDLTSPLNRQAAFSLLYLGINFGTALGSVIAGFLFRNHMQLLFLGDAATTIGAAALLLLYVKETKPAKEELKARLKGREGEEAEKGGVLAALLRRPALIIFSLVNSMYSFMYAQTNFSMPLQSTALFGQELGPRYFGTFNLVNCLMVIFFTTAISVITRKRKPIYNIASSGLFFAFGFGMLFFVKSFSMFVVSTIIWTIGEIINAVNVGVYIANHTPITHRGRFNSITGIINGIGGAISPYIAGGFIAVHGVTNIWPIIFAIGMSASFFMLMLGIVENKKAAEIHSEVLGSDL
ncbi:MAG: MFS transporter [Bacillota bacterium]|nr:MFS transporter [Bacillota bacterium]